MRIVEVRYVAAPLDLGGKQPDRLVTAAKERNKDQHRNWHAKQPQQYVSHSALLFVSPVGAKGRETIFHDCCPLSIEPAGSAGKPAATGARNIAAAKPSANRLDADLIVSERPNTVGRPPTDDMEDWGALR
jgi:hypothetical protein